MSSTIRNNNLNPKWQGLVKDAKADISPVARGYRVSSKASQYLSEGVEDLVAGILPVSTGNRLHKGKVHGKEKVHITDLPYEMLFSIFNHLAYAYRGRAASVCWQWHTVVNDPLFYRSDPFSIKQYLPATIRFSREAQQIKTKLDEFYKNRKLLVQAILPKTEDYLPISLRELSKTLLTALEQLFLDALKGKPCNDIKKYSHALLFFLCAAFQDFPLLEDVYESGERNIQVPKMKPLRKVFYKLLYRFTAQKAILITLLDYAVKIKNFNLVRVILNVARENEPDVIDEAFLGAYGKHETNSFCDAMVENILESDALLADTDRVRGLLGKFTTLYPCTQYSLTNGIVNNNFIIHNTSNHAYRLKIGERIPGYVNHSFYYLFFGAVEQRDVKGLRYLLRLHSQHLDQDIFTAIITLALKNQDLSILQMLYEFYAYKTPKLDPTAFEQCGTSENSEISTWWNEKVREKKLLENDAL